MEHRFSSQGREYFVDEFGVIHQTDAKPFTYDPKYCQTYDTEAYRKGNDILQSLRLGFVIGAHGNIPFSLLDVGYGNGAFLRACGGVIPSLMGKDVTGVPLYGVELVEQYAPASVYTFWDVFEHIEDLSFIENVDCETICMSMPACRPYEPTEEWHIWFNTEYKHRKPDEHLHHFNAMSLKDLMNSYGWREKATSFHEDIIRKNTYSPNILSMAFKRI